MLQLKLASDVHDSDLLRRHIEDNADEIESTIGDDVPLSVSVKRIAKNFFAIHLHARLFGRLFVVEEEDTNLFHAVTRARRHLLRQVTEIRHQRLRQMRRARAYA